jgi:hypothetical protein
MLEIGVFPVMRLDFNVSRGLEGWGDEADRIGKLFESRLVRCALGRGRGRSMRRIGRLFPSRLR